MGLSDTGTIWLKNPASQIHLTGGCFGIFILSRAIFWGDIPIESFETPTIKGNGL
jgi:hypothetical protein